MTERQPHVDTRRRQEGNTMQRGLGSRLVVEGQATERIGSIVNSRRHSARHAVDAAATR